MLKNDIYNLKKYYFAKSQNNFAYYINFDHSDKLIIIRMQIYYKGSKNGKNNMF